MNNTKDKMIILEEFDKKLYKQPLKIKHWDEQEYNTKDIDKVIEELIQNFEGRDIFFDLQAQKILENAFLKVLKNQKKYYERMVKEMIGEEEKYTKYSYAFENSKFDSNTVRHGINRKRDRIIRIVKKYNINI